MIQVNIWRELTHSLILSVIFIIRQGLLRFSFKHTWITVLRVVLTGILKILNFFFQCYHIFVHKTNIFNKRLPLWVRQTKAFTIFLAVVPVVWILFILSYMDCYHFLFVPDLNHYRFIFRKRINRVLNTFNLPLLCFTYWWLLWLSLFEFLFFFLCSILWIKINWVLNQFYLTWGLGLFLSHKILTI